MPYSRLTLAVFGLFLQLSNHTIAEEREQASAAVARPCQDIVTDGVLSEWPDDLQYYQIEGAPVAYPGSSVLDGSDLSARFMVCYDPEQDLIHLAVEVTDDTIIVGDDYLTTDACELYLHPGTQEWSGGPFLYVLVPGEGSYGTSGVNPWGPGGLSRLAASYRRAGDLTTYEFSVELPTAEDFADLAPGDELGFDVVIVDKDRDEVAAWVPWGPRVVEKRVAIDRVGRLRLMPGR